MLAVFPKTGAYVLKKLVSHTKMCFMESQTQNYSLKIVYEATGYFMLPKSVKHKVG